MTVDLVDTKTIFMCIVIYIVMVYNKNTKLMLDFVVLYVLWGIYYAYGVIEYTQHNREERMGQNRLLAIYILRILQSYASKEQKMSQAQMLQYLERDYGITVDRKTLSAYLKQLREEEYIKGQRGFYRVNYFNDSELRLLIDGVLFGQHVPTADAKILINKLKYLTSASLRNRLKHIYYLEGIHHTDNPKLYSILDTLDSAIEQKRKVEIMQCAYNTKGELVERSTAAVSPYYIVASKSMYYLICYADRFDDVENRRIDRILSAKILSEQATPLREIGNYRQCPFSLSKYMKEHIYMFSGECEWITMKVETKAIGDVIDWYGKDFRILEEQEDYVILRLTANSNAVYYWALQYGAKVEILKPQSLRTRIREGLEEMLEKYGGECD